MSAIRELIEAVENRAAPSDTAPLIAAVFPDERHAYWACMILDDVFGAESAALALMAAVLPNEQGWWWSIGHHDKEAPRYNADVWRTGPNFPFYRQNPALADTPARALLLAILKAMEAQR